MRLAMSMRLGRMPGWRSFLSALGLLWLNACASLAPPAGGGVLPQRDALRDFSLEARFSLRYEDKSYAGRLSWRHAGEHDELLLSSPLGQGMAEIFGDPGRVRLQAGDGKSYVADDAETLTQQVLGYPLPLGNLAGWVRGRPGSAKSKGVEVAAPDAFGRPLRLHEDGWRIDYEYDGDDAQALPARLFIERQGVLELRLRIDEWASLPGKERGP